MSRHYSAALPVAYVVLRVLIVLNWLYGAAILGLLVMTFVDQEWTMRALDVPESLDYGPVLLGMRTMAGLGLLAVPLNHLVLRRLVAIVETVRQGDPFIAANAYRLHAIAWVLVGLNLLSMVIGGIAGAISSRDYPLHVDAGFSINGWLAVLLTFVLARVFAAGAVMREDLEGTI